jgi:UDP-glucose 4-epimerase
VRQVIDAVELVTGRSVPVVSAARRPGDPAVLVASNDLGQRLLGWRPVRGLEQMVRDAWEFANHAA